MHSKIALLLLLAGTAPAQFSGLAPTDDGSQLYFASNLPLESELSLNLPTYSGAIYKIQAGTITRMTMPISGAGCGFTCPSQGNPQISGDASVFSYTDSIFCTGGSACITQPSTSASPVSVDGKSYATLTGAAQISANGRFVVNAGASVGYSPASPFPTLTAICQLLDLRTGNTYSVPDPPANGRQAVTQDGQVLTLNAQSGALTLWSPQGARILATTETPRTAIVNAAGTWVVYNAAAPSIEWHLRGLNVASGQDVLLARSGLAFTPSISNDGNTVLYVAVPGIAQAAQMFTTHPDGTGNAQLTNLPQAVDAAAIAGLGTTAFAVTGSRLVQVDTGSGAVLELIGRTPACGSVASLVPGSIFAMDGAGLSDVTEAAPEPLPSTLGGAQMLADGTPLPLLSVSPGEIWFQVPWELTPRASIGLQLAHSPVFEGCPVENIPVYDRIAWFFTPTVLIAAHQDFSGLVGLGSPAQPGEIIHTYATGLGAVTPAIATGIAAPADQLFPVSNPLECHVGYDPIVGQPLEVDFAGLAPGSIGVYQVDIRMPPPAAGVTDIYMNCGSAGYMYGRSGGHVAIAAGQ